MKAESVSKDGVPVDWCERCECAVIHEATLCEDCVADIAISDEEFRGSEQVGVERYDAQMETQNSASVPAQSITSYDLAKALRRILDSAFAAPEVERAHELLERYESQKKLGIAVAATGWTSAYVVELEPGCWLADGKGDPARTIVLSNARIFKSHTGAEVSVINARRHRPFRNAKVVEVKASAIVGSNTAAELRDLLYLIVSAYSALDGAHTDCDPERAHECHLRLRAHIESAMAALSNSEHSKPALSEVEKAAVNVVNAHDVVGRISHRTVRGIEASVDSDKMIEALRDALKRIGAL